MLRFLQYLLLLVALFHSVPSAAQEGKPAKPQPPALTGSVSFGVSFTSGNSDSSNLNLAFETGYDPPSPHAARAKGLYLRGTKNGQVSVARLQMNLRDDYQVRDGTSVFAQTQFLRDTFKGIQSLVAPTFGLGHAVVRKPSFALDLDAGIGGVWEKNPLRRTQVSGAVTAGQKLKHKLSESAEVVQSLAALWKLETPGDALYDASIGLAAALTARSELKITLLDSYKTNLTSGGRKKNDVSLIAAIVFKLQ